ncbi:PHP domain-containing protein [Desulfotruncus alcoholivorax]|uniref:PHP domain-containing protein n=1 Tax=Desulfotruncus alcoholivorax TaxID=265477 RepID=UPI000417B722|nr:hypothetical protein [Desulfotruncus alcoholivorax]
MLKSFLKADFHSHPLGDRYYPNPPKELTDDDKESIIGFLKAMAETGLEIIACTDHNTVLSGQWAKEQARREKLPLIVIPGAELNVWGYTQRVHLLALNIKSNLSTGQLGLSQAVKEIHHQGGVAILAHPVKYPQEIRSNPEVFNEIDGIEMNNASEGIFPTSDYLNAESRYNDKFIIQTTGSDLHWEPQNKINKGKSHPYFQVPTKWLLEKGIISPLDL